MGNFAMTIWNSTCNPCFSTFDQFFFVFHGLKTGFSCYSLNLNFICYLNRFFTNDYSLWDGGDIRFCLQKQTLIVVAMFVIGSGRNEQSAKRTFQRCFLPSFGSFGQSISEEKIFRNRPIRNKNCLWWPCL
jgi:hypothetical protein